MLPELERSVARWRRRVLLGAWMARFGWQCAALLFAAGAAILVARVGFGLERGAVASWLALGALAAATAWLGARRVVPSAAAAATWLDVHSGSSGLVVTERELGESEWSRDSRACIAHGAESLPRMAWRRSLAPLAPALLFAAGALWFEPPQGELGPPRAVTNAAVERVEEKLATLEETLTLEPDLAAELRQRMERIEAEADSGAPESTFEAIDQLEQRVEASALDALDLAQRSNEQLSQAATDPSLADAQASLESALESLRAAGLDKPLPEFVSAQIDAASLTLPPGLQLDSAQLAKLAQSLHGDLAGKLAKLAKAGLLSAEHLGRLGELAGLDDFDFDHVCDEDCKKPGGT